MSAANQRDNAMVRQELSSLIGFLSRLPSIPERYQSVLEGGSVERGRSLFENHTAIQCLRCHRVGGKGGNVGPDLSKIGGKFSREYLLESLLAPELKIAEGFEGVTISTLDGRVLTGTVQEEREQEIRIVDAEGKTLVIAKDEIDQRQGGKSVMPSNLLELINSSDLRDLVEYLASLK
jgi:quinoprotein glucose dehydrogenase